MLKLNHSVSKSKSIWGEFLWVCPFMYIKNQFICLWVVAIQKRKHPTWPATIHSINQPYTPFSSFQPNSSAMYNPWWAKYCSMARYSHNGIMYFMETHALQKPTCSVQEEGHSPPTPSWTGYASITYINFAHQGTTTQ